MMIEVIVVLKAFVHLHVLVLYIYMCLDRMSILVGELIILTLLLSCFSKLVIAHFLALW